MDVINGDKLGDKAYVYKHKSGLTAYILPKPGYSRKHAAFAANFGSIDVKFKTQVNEDIIEVPDGVAHFLEHKLFEQENGSIMEDFAKYGASPNAYTGFSNTVYLFSCTANFNECLKLLLNFVQKPYFTNEGIEKEKSIISQEILMKQDEPEWIIYFNLLKSLFPNHPVSRDIAGSRESISYIDRDLLYKCYNSFYHPSNMVLVIVGDCNPEEVFSIVTEEMDTITQAVKPVEFVRLNEKTGWVSENRNEEKEMAVSNPLFQLGIRDKMPDLAITDKDKLLRQVTLNILLDLIVGRSSRLYNDLYSEGLVNGPVDFDCNSERTYAFTVLAGESSYPKQFKERVEKEILDIKKNGISEENFKRLRNSWYGKLVRTFNSVESISYSFISVYFKGVTLFDYFDVYDKISLKYANDLFREHFDPDSMALSVVRPFGSRSG